MQKFFRFDDIFLRVLEMTGSGSLVILVVVLLRWFLRKAPKACSYVLWGVVLFRLLCPFSFDASWGVLPEIRAGETYSLANDQIRFSGAAEAAVRAVGDAVNGGLGIQRIRTADHDVVSSHWWEVWILFGKYVWILGLLALVIYAVYALLKLKRQLRISMPLLETTWSDSVVREKKPDVFLVDGLQTAFVLGLLRPNIYLPSDLSSCEREYILLHERQHIRRLDHIWKLLGFAALCIHWFNPLVWLAFHLAQMDMEMSCDEAVIKKLGEEIRKAYSTSLLRLSAGKQFVPQMPLAFGEGDTENRVRHVMKYRKPAVVVTIFAMILALVAVILFSADRVAGNRELLAAVYRTDLVVYSSDGIGGPTESGPMYAVTADHQLYRKNLEAEPWHYLGALTPYNLTNRELSDYAHRDAGWATSYRLREITDAWYLAMENNMFYLVFQTKNGDTLLSYGWEDVGERWQGASDDTSLSFLYRLQPTGDVEGTIGLTMTSLLQGPLLTFDTIQRGQYHVYGFAAGEEYRDWGYAIFREYDGALRLLDWHLYENAALAENAIYVCPDPAVLSDDGTMTNENTYDVVLNQNSQLASIIHIIKMDGETYETNEQMLYGQPLILLNWADQDAPKPHSVSRHFYDKQGEQIEVSSMTQEDLLLAIFDAGEIDAEPLDWVLADDGSENLLGAVLYEKDSCPWVAFVSDHVCGIAGIGEGKAITGQMRYEGNATVSTVRENEAGVQFRCYLSYTYNKAEKNTHFEYWNEIIAKP